MNVADLFWAKVEVGVCWDWQASKTPGGYGTFSAVCAHRWAWEHLVGPIPRGMEVDHLCHNPGCVNPDHMEIVTPAENKRRRRYFPKTWTRSECKRGHDITNPENVYEYRGHRSCRPCRIGRSRAHREV